MGRFVVQNLFIFFGFDVALPDVGLMHRHTNREADWMVPLLCSMEDMVYVVFKAAFKF